jgi:hypothetical protein
MFAKTLWILSVFSFPRSSVGMQCVTFQRHETQERLGVDSHAEAWEPEYKTIPSYNNKRLYSCLIRGRA